MTTPGGGTQTLAFVKAPNVTALQGAAGLESQPAPPAIAPGARLYMQGGRTGSPSPRVFRVAILPGPPTWPSFSTSDPQ